MATQTFTAGQILTAAQLTTLQSNSGLQHITGASLPEFFQCRKIHRLAY